ncbi:hypothetical protein GQ42DRAFT_49975 [Ramicandelaber brevisporus]|nr:hypothetical protein GQ42DRAFT_49975 [Ramicandelaber brevisporus]
MRVYPMHFLALLWPLAAAVSIAATVIFALLYSNNKSFFQYLAGSPIFAIIGGGVAALLGLLWSAITWLYISRYGADGLKQTDNPSAYQDNVEKTSMLGRLNHPFVLGLVSAVSTGLTAAAAGTAIWSNSSIKTLCQLGDLGGLLGGGGGGGGSDMPNRKRSPTSFPGLDDIPGLGDIPDVNSLLPSTSFCTQWTVEGALFGVALALFAILFLIGAVWRYWWRKQRDAAVPIVFNIGGAMHVLDTDQPVVAPVSDAEMVQNAYGSNTLIPLDQQTQQMQTAQYVYAVMGEDGTVYPTAAITTTGAPSNGATHMNSNGTSSMIPAGISYSPPIHQHAGDDSEAIQWNFPSTR